MSLRTNLSTRPFYNERAVQTVIVMLALIVAAATVFNVWRLVSLTQRDRALGAAAAQAETRARTLRQQAARVRGGIDQTRLTEVSNAAREANAVIHGRTFSWTALFNRLESTLPPEVRIVSVQPKVDVNNRLMVSMAVEAREVAAIDQFIDALEGTGTFDDLLARSEQENDEGLIDARLEGYYLPDNAPDDAAPPAPTDDAVEGVGP
jgi:hypothetical protein